MMGETIQQRDDGSGVWKDQVPVLEGTIGRDENGTVLITAVDDLVEQISSMSVVGEVTDLIDAE